MAEANTLLISGFGFVLLFLGLAGSVLPVLPGPFLIWLGALVWAWGNGFQEFGWTVLIIMGVLAVLAWGSDLVINTIFTRRAGASWKAIGGAIVFGIVGSALLSGTIPILGTLVGAMVGAVVGLWVVEYSDKRDKMKAWRAVRAYIAAMIVASAVELTLSFAMLGIFIWQAYL